MALTALITGYKGQIKSWFAEQDILMECDQMGFIFQHNPPSDPHTPFINFAVLGSHWLQKSSIADMMSSYELLTSAY